MLFRRLFQNKKGLWASLLAMLLLPALAHAFEPFVVRDIRVEGIQRIDAGTVFGYGGQNYPMYGNPQQPDEVTFDLVDSHQIRSSVGASLLWASPLGPLRFDYAYVLTKNKYDDTQAFRFGTIINY